MGFPILVRCHLYIESGLLSLASSPGDSDVWWKWLPGLRTSATLHPAQEWGLLSQFPLFRYFSHFSASPKYMLAIKYHVHIWQVSPQLSCGDICQIWMWCEESNRYFSRMENFAYGQINERSFSNPHTRIGGLSYYIHSSMRKPTCTTNVHFIFSSILCFLCFTWNMQNCKWHIDLPFNIGFIAWI